jgi:hypothetical protein
VTLTYKIEFRLICYAVIFLGPPNNFGAPYTILHVYKWYDFDRVKGSSPFTSDSLRRPAAALHTYRCLKILEILVNSVTRDTFFTVINNSLSALIVLCIFCLIRFGNANPAIVLGVHILFSTFGTVAIVLLYIVLGRYNDVSTGFINSWKRKRDVVYAERKVLLRLMRSCRTLRLEIGIFGHFKKKTSFLIIGKLVFYTTKLLMLTKKKK